MAFPAMMYTIRYLCTNPDLIQDLYVSQLKNYKPAAQVCHHFPPITNTDLFLSLLLLPTTTGLNRTKMLMLVSYETTLPQVLPGLQLYLPT